MSKSLAVSHIFVISKDKNITDLGEYSGHLLHVSSKHTKPSWDDEYKEVPNVEKLDGVIRLVIDHPSTNTKQIFISSDEKVPITDIFSCSNKNGDCLIYGTIKGKLPIIGETAVIVIDPYFSRDVAERLAKEVEVHNGFISRGARYTDNQEDAIRARIRGLQEQLHEKKPEQEQRKNPIIERMKRVQL